MRLDSIQIGRSEPSPVGRLGTTGINKSAVESARITRLGLVGDVVADTEHHGGPDQAVYVYTRDDYLWWEEILGRHVPGGTFGENLTIEGVSSAEVRVGDRFTLGDTVIEATGARIPCAVFQHKVNESDWQRRFREARRPGVYCRVIDEGSVTPGMPLAHHRAVDTISVLETQDLYYDTGADTERIRTALASPIGHRVRDLLELRLTRADS